MYKNVWQINIVNYYTYTIALGEEKAHTTSTIIIIIIIIIMVLLSGVAWSLGKEMLEYMLATPTYEMERSKFKLWRKDCTLNVASELYSSRVLAKS